MKNNEHHIYLKKIYNNISHVTDSCMNYPFSREKIADNSIVVM